MSIDLHDTANYPHNQGNHYEKKKKTNHER